MSILDYRFDEIIRRAAEILEQNGDDVDLGLRTKAKIAGGTDGSLIGNTDDHLKVKQDLTDFRLMIVYMSKMVNELEQIKLQLQVITDIEGDIEA